MAHKRTRSKDRDLRNHVLYLLGGGGAHVGFDRAVAGVPARLRDRKRGGLSLYRLVEHMRIAQWDILEFSRNPAHVSPAFPKGYWPQGPIPKGAWSRSLRSFRRDLRAMEALVRDPKRDLCAPFPHGQGQTLLREALLVADHNAYHLGQIVLLRRLLGAWPED